MGERLRTKNKTRNLFRRIIKESLAKPEELTVSQWAEKYRVLDDSSAIPGRWSNDVTPYLVEIMDCLNDPHIRSVNFCKPTQVGGTETLINMTGWIITENPSPTMIVYPSDDLAKDISKDKLQPAYRKSRHIKERFLENKSKELNLKFKGMNIYLRGAGSPSKLASKAIKYLLFDEIDKIGGATSKEASPYSLAMERTKTFKNTYKVYTCSTPTLKTNYVWKLHEEAEEVKHYYVPCPHCQEYIELLWAQVKFDNDDEKKKTIIERANTARYVCQKCGCVIEDREKPAMLRAGRWQTVKKRCVGKAKTISFRLNSLYSIFINWRDAAEEFLKSKDDPEMLQNFINSWLAEPWEDSKLKTSKELVMERRTDLPEFVVPEWAKVLTGGIDVQETSLYWTVRAWGDHITSQNIAHGQAYSFREVEEMMNLSFQKKNKESMVVTLALMDSGDQTDDVYDFCAENSDWVLPCKGIDGGYSHFRISKVNKATSKAYGMQLVLVDGSKYKDMIAARLQKEIGTGSWMVHKDCDEDYAEQVTAEHKVMQGKGNAKKKVWVLKQSHGDNHYLDAEVYAFAAADMLGVRSMHLQDTEERVEQREEIQPEEQWIKHNENWL